MSALKTKTEKQLRKSLAIKKVLSSIRYAERQKRLKAPLYKEQVDNRNFMLQALQHQYGHEIKYYKQARKHAKEDWKLGPLRPNRAIGMERERYGLLRGRDLGSPVIPEHKLLEREKWPAGRKTWATRIEAWPFAVDDRVVVIKGPDKNKIGQILRVDEERNEVLVKGVRLIYLDGRDINTGDGEEPKLRIEREAPIPVSDIRLVYALERPHPVYENETVLQDVIIDGIDVRKHTSGVDPWTGQVVRTIPIEHQKDPETGEWYYHRYIRGTNQRLEWPWVLEEKKERERLREERKKKNEREKELAAKGPVRQIIDKLFTRGKREELVPEEEERGAEEDAEDKSQLPPAPRPRRDIYTFDCDTTANIVMETNYFPEVLRSPPFPEYVVAELNAWKHEAAMAKEDRKAMTDEEKEAQRAERWAEKQDRMAEVKRRMDERLSLMKTPQQVAWELEHAKKLETRKMEKDVPEELLQKIGQLMIQRGKVPKELKDV